MALIEFLRKRLDNDEAFAHGWHGGGSEYIGTAFPADPKRMLAEIDAKRRILNLHPAYWYTDEEPGFGMWLMECACKRQGTWCPTLLALALPYMEHEDFDADWLPEVAW